MRPFLITFLALSSEDKAALFARHGLTGPNQTAGTYTPVVSFKYTFTVFASAFFALAALGVGLPGLV